MNKSRLVHEKPTFYLNNNVLVGNWFEEKIGSYKKDRFKHNSVYRHDYTEKSLADKTVNDDLRNDIQIKSEFTDHILAQATTNDGPNYQDNFTSIYDLSWEYFPKAIQGTLNRKMRFRLLKHEPVEEYLNGFGNLTSRNGLTQFKREEWECDVRDPRRSVFSTAKADYVRYDNDVYKLSRWPRLTPKKVKCGSATEIYYKQLSANHPRTIEANCNPIIWECKDNGTPPEPCVCKTKM